MNGSQINQFLSDFSVLPFAMHSLSCCVHIFLLKWVKGLVAFINILYIVLGGRETNFHKNKKNFFCIFLFNRARITWRIRKLVLERSMKAKHKILFRVLPFGFATGTTPFYHLNCILNDERYNIFLHLWSVLWQIIRREDWLGKLLKLLAKQNVPPRSEENHAQWENQLLGKKIEMDYRVCDGKWSHLPEGVAYIWNCENQWSFLYLMRFSLTWHGLEFK